MITIPTILSSTKLYNVNQHGLNVNYNDVGYEDGFSTSETEQPKVYGLDFFAKSFVGIVSLLNEQSLPFKQSPIYASKSYEQTQDITNTTTKRKIISMYA